MIEKAKEFAREIFAGDGSGHDFDHTMRVFRMATRLAEEEDADLETVQLAALLHDVDDRKLSPETCENHLRAVTFLKENGASDEKTDRIISIIAQVSFSANKGIPTTLEGKCVQDADRLDALGAIGIGRTFAYGGSRGRRMYDPEKQDPDATIQHFYDKLLLLKDRMQTPTARRMAEERERFMRAFLEEFYAEWDGIR